MKYLQDDALSHLTSLLDRQIGSRHIQGRIEAYTMKRAGSEKKYAADLGSKFTVLQQQQLLQLQQQQLQQQLLSKRRLERSQSVGSAVESRRASKKQRNRANSYDLQQPLPQLASAITPLGDFQTSKTRRLMTDLILTLNLSFPDYDFANISPNDFQNVSLHQVVTRVNANLDDLKEDNHNLLEMLWAAVDKVISLQECEVYLWKNPEDFHERNTLWSFYYLFVSKNLKRILFLTCSESIVRNDEGRDDEDDNDIDDVSIVEAVESKEDDDIETENGDFDLDPTATAGGIPVSTV